MDLHLTTSQIDASVALLAYQLYKEGKCKEAIPVLLDILDVEPKNWHARLFLGACYTKTDQPGAAQRCFRFVYEGVEDSVLKQKACFALQAVTADMQNKTLEIPPEFGGVADRLKTTASRIDSIIE